MDSFRSDDDMADFSRVEEDEKDNNPLKASAQRMHTIAEDPDEESRKTTTTASQVQEPAPVSKPASIRQPLTHATTMPVTKPSPVPVSAAKPATVLKQTTISAVS